MIRRPALGGHSRPRAGKRPRRTSLDKINGEATSREAGPSMSDQRTSSGGTATSGGGSASRGEPQSVRDAYDRQRNGK